MSSFLISPLNNVYFLSSLSLSLSLSPFPLPSHPVSWLDMSLEMARVSVSQTSPSKSSTHLSAHQSDDDLTRQPSVDTLSVEPTITPAKTGSTLSQYFLDNFSYSISSKKSIIIGVSVPILVLTCMLCRKFELILIKLDF